MPDDVVVIGDVMLDIHSIGLATRLSPEAPVPVLENPRTAFLLGGAANTAANVASLGGSVSLIGAIGDDDHGSETVRLCEKFGIKLSTERIADYETTSKHRFMANNRQILRVDRERREVPRRAETQIHGAVAKAQGTVFVVSDYQKGVITETVAMRALQRAEKIKSVVIVDSKSTDFRRFEGAHLLTPNLREAFRATGESDPHEAAKKLHSETGARILVTLGSKGMLLFSDGKFYPFASRVVQVSDVTGAGDTVIAAVAIAIAEGGSTLDAVSWANKAAGVAVQHPGTYSVSREEI